MTPIRILVVEDDPAARTLLAALLPGLAGLSLCGLASDGWEGLELLERTRPDAVLLDLIMPGLDGLGFLRALRQTPHRPVVVVTSQASQPGLVRHAISLGASYYLVKPINLEALPALLDSLCLGPWVRDGERLLREMGAAGKGVQAAAVAAAILARDGDALLKEAYAPIIAAEHSSYASVEKRIRAMIGRLYPAGGPAERPSNDVFLRRLAGKLRSGRKSVSQPPDFP